jgi:ribosome-associated protein
MGLSPTIDPGTLAAVIQISPYVTLREEELEFAFVRASGPGGQKVNKASTAVQLRFDAGRAPGIPEEVRDRLRELAGRRMTAEGVLILEASRHRSQRQNREEALQRLLALLREASRRGKHRHPTRPGPSQRERRLSGKRRRSELKRRRSPPRANDE